MDNSKFLGKVIGIYLIIVSVAMFLDRAQFVTIVKQLIDNVPLMFVVGFFTLIIGILMVVAHNIWQWHWRLIITIISWLTLIKGISIIFYPQYIDKLSIFFLQSTEAGYISAVVNLLIGLVLCYFSFREGN